MLKGDEIILVQLTITVGDIKRALEIRGIIASESNVQKVNTILLVKGWKKNVGKESDRFIDKWIDQMIEENILKIAEETRGGGD